MQVIDKTTLQEEKKQSGKKKLSEKTIFAGTISVVVIIFALFVFFFIINPSHLNQPTGANILPTSQKTQNNQNGQNQINQNSDTVIAIIENEKVYLQELEERYATVPEELKQSISRKQVFDNLIENKLVLQEAQKNNVSVTEQEITQAMQIQQEQINQLIAEGTISQEFMQRAVKEYLIVTKFLNEFVFNNIGINQEKIQEFFNSNKEQIIQVRASHILVETEQEAKDLAEQLKNGANFEELAKQKSKDTGSAALGGDIGFFSRQEVVPEFADTAFSMQEGEAEKITKSQFGYHVIKVTGKKESLQDFEEQIKQLVESQEKDKTYAEFIEKLKKEKNIQIFLTETSPVV